MDKSKRKQLEEAGWKVGNSQDFLELSDDETAYIEMKLALARELINRRKKKLHCSQSELATRLGSSQSRVAKMEAADDLVSIDLLVRSLLRVGASQKDVARALVGKV